MVGGRVCRDHRVCGVAGLVAPHDIHWSGPLTLNSHCCSPDSAAPGFPAPGPQTCGVCQSAPCTPVTVTWLAVWLSVGW